ncbi:mandelate racemase/muconate lactonizing enzyme family protein [Phaeobacter gallaeciensis]|uniref:Mandelate racemase/muconate lactonizing enzyme n=1 Tax=Phaeobacter gallaeciensis TaxID=60890 RepID=A0AAC9ZCI3_9RHOB|nr:mandelate racemase/muconate lactonizing enzyme family protein [Phaeobacter gallaeciensis]AHD11454.1 L-alanine-DL-glutamate epimerase [Phaeobacter gallaeciensis DSM 26640]ATE94718.1 putative mandelate racemase/muconate lactonizing enzyme [Phaeobacter gallaeciensis]ATE98990.1 putative mandelate racemase/muconate lactonizing enzyme [Phaeobacter gallaeciensis]ATF03382.1 putative mandelate racemase/muconate lactonizing enzyme [Phaeobacter gallaeciensis]ATF07762.1 putative mandelate racemase/muco
MSTPYSASGAVPVGAGRGKDDGGPRIRRIETFCSPLVGFVRVTSEDGQQGWGQVSTYNSDLTCEILHRQVAPWALGRGMDAMEAVIAEIPLREHKYPGTYLRRAMAGLDTAVWDWRGRVAQKPVAELLGGSAGPIRAYASSMRRDITPEDEAERMKALRDDLGFDAFKVRVGAECGEDRDEWPGRTETIIPQIRAALGEGAALLVDGNSGFSPKRSIEVGQLLQEHGYEHFEEPCPYWMLEQTAEVTRALDLDVAGGEQDWDLQTWHRMIEMRAVDIIQPDILYLGGMTRSMEVARLGAAAGLPCTPHCANLSMVTLFTMHMLRAVDLPGRYLEFSIEGEDYYPWQRDLFVTDPFVISDGQAVVRDVPGWGVEINPEWLATSKYTCSEDTP